MKKKITAAYLLIGLLFGIYGWLFGQFEYRGLFYNLGRGLIWPAVMFAALGQIIGGIILVIFIAVILIL